MNKYIALFRGINVGGNNILPMKDLVVLLEGLGFENVRTYFQSGNVIFQTRNTDLKKIGKAITAAISASYGFEPKVLLLTSADLQAVMENNPFATEEGKALHCFFMAEQPKNPELDQLRAVKAASEDFALGKDVFYLYAPEGIGRSRLASKVEKCLGVAVTARNWNTVSKLFMMTNR